MIDALVVGAGISGLAAARSLRRRGLKVQVLEAADRPGGNFRTRRQNGFTVELGPNTVQETPELRALCRDADCAADLVPAADAARKRYLFHRARLQALPSSPPGILTSPLLSWRAKIRLATEPWRRRQNDWEDETVGSFLSRRLGQEAAATLGDAIVQGVYAGDPEELATRFAYPRLWNLEKEYGSLIKGLRRQKPSPRRLMAFRGGLERLAQRLAEGLDIRLGAAALELTTEEEAFGVITAGRGTFRAPRLILAVPQPTAEGLLLSLESKAPPAEATGPELPTAPVAVVALGYRREDVGHPLDGFVFLAPHGAGLPLLGCLFSSTLFPHRVPRDHVLLTVMIGGRRRPHLVEGDDDFLFELAQSHLTPLLGLRGEPVLQVLQRWQPGIPQPTAAVAVIRRRVEAMEKRHPGLKVLGGWLGGVGIPDCIASGWRLGES